MMLLPQYERATCCYDALLLQPQQLLTIMSDACRR